jgi:hypothetical protein
MGFPASLAKKSRLNGQDSLSLSPGGIATLRCSCGVQTGHRYLTCEYAIAGGRWAAKIAAL